MINRRTLLKGAALGTAGVLGISGRRLARGREPAPAAGETPKSRMTLAVETSMFGRRSVPTADWAPEAFEMIRKAGFRFVELGGRHLRAAAGSRESVARLRRQLKDAGVSPVAAFIVHGIASSDEKQRQEAVARWRRSVDTVSQLGLKLLTTELTGDRTQPEKGEAAFRKSMDQLLPVFEDAGIHLSAEPHPGDFFEAAGPTIKLLRSYGSKHLGYLHCIPHTFYLGKSMPEVIGEAGKLLSHVHVSDTFRTERIMARGGTGLHLHLRPGLGEVDFQETFHALTGIGYRGYASVQLLSHADAPGRTAEQARKYLEGLLAERLTT